MTKNILALLVAGGLTIGFGASLATAQDSKGGTAPTANTQPKEKEKGDKKEMKAEGAKVGEKAPAFSLTDTDGKTVSLADMTKEKKIVVVEWFNPSCPYVVKHYENGANTMNDTAKAFADKNVVWVRIATNISKEDLAKAKTNWKLDGVILQDTDGKVAGAYGSKNTPTMFIINADGVLAYRGAIDDDNGAEKPGKTNYVKNALEQVVKGETVTTPETKAYGCRVKAPKA